MTNDRPPLRAFRDRIRQVLLFEAGGLLLITPAFAWASGVPVTDSFGLLAVVAVIAALWNSGYNTGFDWIEGRLTGKTADRRPLFRRIVHAVGFEGGLLLASLPIVMIWTGMGWFEALVADLGIAARQAGVANGLLIDRLRIVARKDRVDDHGFGSPVGIDRSKNSCTRRHTWCPEPD